MTASSIWLVIAYCGNDLTALGYKQDLADVASSL